MSAVTALFTASIFVLFNPAPASVDPFAAAPAEAAVDPLSTAVPSPDGAGWSAPAPPPLPPPPRPPPPRRPPAQVVEAPYPAATPAEQAPTNDAPARSPAAAAEAANRTFNTGLILLGGSVAAAAGSIYTWREHQTRSGHLRAQEQANAVAAAAGVPPTATAELREDIKRYRGLTIGLAVTAGVLALVGGGVALSGHRQRQRTLLITMRAGGVGVQF